MYLSNCAATHNIINMCDSGSRCHIAIVHIGIVVSHRISSIRIRAHTYEGRCNDHSKKLCGIDVASRIVATYIESRSQSDILLIVYCGF